MTARLDGLARMMKMEKWAAVMALLFLAFHGVVLAALLRAIAKKQ